MSWKDVSVRVWGDFALFTRPESKVERVTYQVITPSAARGVLEAILWKPEIRYQIQSIEVLRPIKYFGLLRNEVDTKASPKSPGIAASESRQQRHSVVLRDVAYNIHARIYLKAGGDHPVQKYSEMFVRRVEAGQCFHRPCLGTREFACDFSPVIPDERPIELCSDLGLMLHDLDFISSGRGNARFFDAKLLNGVMSVPAQPHGRAV
jgi:CRISPR-associated protein Cas5d